MLLASHAQLTPYVNNANTTIDISQHKLSFPNNYINARDNFLSLCKRVKITNHDAVYGSYFAESQVDPDLSTDFLYLPQSQQHLVIITSGIHGAESYAGSSIQELLIKKILSQELPRVSFLFIHGLNPYGFKYFTRTNENNIDLNRNYGSSETFSSANDSYQKNKDIFHPENKVSQSVWQKLKFYIKIGWINFTDGKKEILYSLSGQFSDAKGTNYGGKKTEPQTVWNKNLIRHHGKKYPRILHIDLHTGFGEKGVLHYYISNHISTAEYNRAKTIFKDLPLKDGDDDHFYPTYGAFDDWMWRTFSEKNIVSMVFEFGTLDSQTFRGGLNSLWALTKENQGRNHGYSDENSRQQTQKQFEELFNPQDLYWQQSILNQASDSLDKAILNFSQQ